MLGLFCPKWRKVQKRHQLASDFALSFQSGKVATRWPRFFQSAKTPRAGLRFGRSVSFIRVRCWQHCVRRRRPQPRPPLPASTLGLNVWSFGFGVLGFKISGLRSRVRVRGLGLASRFGLGVCSVGCTVSGLRFGGLTLSTSGLGFRIWGLKGRT